MGRTQVSVVPSFRLCVLCPLSFPRSKSRRVDVVYDSRVDLGDPNRHEVWAVLGV